MNWPSSPIGVWTLLAYLARSASCCQSYCDSSRCSCFRWTRSSSASTNLAAAPESPKVCQFRSGWSRAFSVAFANWPLLAPKNSIAPCCFDYGFPIGNLATKHFTVGRVNRRSSSTVTRSSVRMSSSNRKKRMSNLTFKDPKGPAVNYFLVRNSLTDFVSPLRPLSSSLDRVTSIFSIIPRWQATTKTSFYKYYKLIIWLVPVPLCHYWVYGASASWYPSCWS